MDFEVIIEFLKAVGPAITAIAAACAAWIGYKGLHKWQFEGAGKKDAELAEDVLAGFYEVRDIISSIRSPLSFSNEGAERIPQPNETPDQKRQRDSYFTPLARMDTHRTKLSKLMAKRYRMRARFGEKVDLPFKMLNEVLAKIQASASMLIRTAGRDFAATLPANRQKWEADIWEAHGEALDTGADEIKVKVEEAVTLVETLCQHALKPHWIK